MGTKTSRFVCNELHIFQCDMHFEKVANLCSTALETETTRLETKAHSSWDWKTFLEAKKVVTWNLEGDAQ
jgi:hypothetical protein